MKMKWQMGIAIVCMGIAGQLHGQVRPRGLADEIETGRIGLVSARGNGGSSGSVVDADLVNETGTEQDLGVLLDPPIYLENEGAGPNMVVSAVYLSGGTYFSDEGTRFITLSATEPTHVSLVAYSVDFGQDNPSKSDIFTVGDALPAGLAPVVANINTHVSAHPDANVTVAAQLAIWMAQGKKLSEISPKFPFTAADARLARDFIP